MTEGSITETGSYIDREVAGGEMTLIQEWKRGLEVELEDMRALLDYQV